MAEPFHCKCWPAEESWPGSGCFAFADPGCIGINGVDFRSGTTGELSLSVNWACLLHASVLRVAFIIESSSYLRKWQIPGRHRTEQSCRGYLPLAGCGDEKPSDGPEGYASPEPEGHHA